MSQSKHSAETTTTEPRNAAKGFEMQRITTAKIDRWWMAIIDHQHEGHASTEAAAIADAKKSKRSSDEDDALAADDERLMREDA